MLRPALAVFLGWWVGFFLARMRFKYSQAIFFTATVATFLPYQVVLFPLTYLLMRLDVITLGTVVSGDTVLLHGTHWGVEKTIAHELSHVVVHLATENPYADIPAWLDEGLAMYNEGEFPAANREALERAIRENRLISVRSLTAPHRQARGDSPLLRRGLWRGRVPAENLWQGEDGGTPGRLQRGGRLR